MPPRPNPGPPSPQAPTIYQSPPGSGGNDGAMPTAYNFNWQYFTNLTPAQITWFESQPDWADFVAAVTANPTTTASPPVMANPISNRPPVTPGPNVPIPVPPNPFPHT